MSSTEHPAHRLLRKLHDFERRYALPEGELSADDAFVLSPALRRLSEHIIVDHRQLKAAEHKHRRTR